MAYDNTNSGALFRNDRRKNDRAPEYTGKCDIGGKEFWISAWVKESKNTGKKFFSLSFDPVDSDYSAPSQASHQESEDVPF